MSSEELKEKIYEVVMKSKKLLTSRDIADKLNVKKRLVDKVVYELIDEGRLEYYSVGGATYVRIPKPEE